jgi:hypothetical protein
LTPAGKGAVSNPGRRPERLSRAAFNRGIFAFSSEIR